MTNFMKLKFKLNLNSIYTDSIRFLIALIKNIYLLKL